MKWHLWKYPESYKKLWVATGRPNSADVMEILNSRRGTGWAGRQALGHSLSWEGGWAMGGREGSRQGRGQSRWQWVSEGGSGMRMWTLPPDHLPRGQQPTYTVFFPRLYAENMKTKSSTLITEVKRLSHLNPEMPTLGLTPPKPQPQDAGFKTNFISSIYGRREADWTDTVSQSQSDHLTSGQRESRWAEISQPGKPREESSGLEFRRIWEPWVLDPVWLLVTGLSLPRLPCLWWMDTGAGRPLPTLAFSACRALPGGEDGKGMQQKSL